MTADIIAESKYLLQLGLDLKKIVESKKHIHVVTSVKKAWLGEKF